MNEREISRDESCSDHNFLKYKIGIANSFNNVHKYEGVRYIVKEDNYQEFDRKLVQEIFKFFKNVNYKGSVEEMDINLSTIISKENHLEK